MKQPTDRPEHDSIAAAEELRDFYHAAAASTKPHPHVPEPHHPAEPTVADQLVKKMAGFYRRQFPKASPVLLKELERFFATNTDGADMHPGHNSSVVSRGTEARRIAGRLVDSALPSGSVAMDSVVAHGNRSGGLLHAAHATREEEILSLSEVLLQAPSPASAVSPAAASRAFNTWRHRHYQDTDRSP